MVHLREILIQMQARYSIKKNRVSCPVPTLPERQLLLSISGSSYSMQLFIYQVCVKHIRLFQRL